MKIKFVDCPMYRSDASRVQLSEMLGGISGEGFNWQMVDFDGVGVMPENLSVDEFRNKVRSSPVGVMMTWSELLAFSRNLEYVIDIFLVASNEAVGDFEDLDKVLEVSEIVLQALDSTEWRIYARENLLMKKLVSIAGGG